MLKNKPPHCEFPNGEGNKARGRGLPPASSQEEIEALSSAVCKVLNATNNHEFESRFFPSPASDETEALADTFITVLFDRNAEDPDKPGSDSYRNCEILQVCCFELLNL